MRISFSIPRAYCQRMETQQTDCAEGLWCWNTTVSKQQGIPEHCHHKPGCGWRMTNLWASRRSGQNRPGMVHHQLPQPREIPCHLAQQNLTRSTSDSTCIPCTMPGYWDALKEAFFGLRVVPNPKQVIYNFWHLVIKCLQVMFTDNYRKKQYNLRRV